MVYLGVILYFFCFIYFLFAVLKCSVSKLWCVVLLVQLDLIVAIGSISLLHYCQFGTENHSLLQKPKKYIYK